MPRDFCFGLIRVPMWDYYWGLTAAQVELLTIDQPIVVYKKECLMNGYTDIDYLLAGADDIIAYENNQ